MQSHTHPPGANGCRRSKRVGYCYAMGCCAGQENFPRAGQGGGCYAPATRLSGEIMPPLPSSEALLMLRSILIAVGFAAAAVGAVVLGFFFFLLPPPCPCNGRFRGWEIFPLGGRRGFGGRCLIGSASSSMRSSPLLACNLAKKKFLTTPTCSPRSSLVRGSKGGGGLCASAAELLLL